MITIEIKETLLRTIRIECDSKDKALKIVKSQYEYGNIVLGRNDFIDAEFSILKEEEQ